MVVVGGSANVRISQDDYNHAIAASKPSTMMLRFLDKLFSKETLLKSTLYGTKRVRCPRSKPDFCNKR